MSAAMLPLILVLPFGGALAALMLRPNARNAEAWLAGGCTLAAFVIVAGCWPQVSAGQTLRLAADWLPALGLQLSLRLDGFAWMLALIVTGIGFLVVLYARYYLSAADPMPRFFAFFLAFMASMLGVVLAGNLIQLVLFWELTSLFSFLLIGYWHHNPSAREGARMALIVTSAGGLALFAGVLLIGRIVGSWELDRVLAAGDLIRSHPLYLPALLLVVLGALTKSAQFPFHFWLPHAMAAPTPVSAYLHSAAMVKLGVILLMRLWPVLSGTDAWMFSVGLAGLVTFVLGAYAAMFQYDLKGLLAYSTISHLGLITVLLGLNSPLALVAAIFHLMNHATFKASLFMAAGAIDHESGTRDIRRLSGLVHYMPITATAAMVAAAAMAGVPLLNGFLSKEMFFAESLDASGPLPLLDRLLPYVATAAGMFGVVYSLRFILGAFFGPPATDLPHTPHEPPRLMRLPIELLVLVCVVVGVLPNLTVRPLLDVAVPAVLGTQAPPYELRLWHGFNMPLLMSTVAMAGGVLLYRLLRTRLAGEGVPLLPPIDGRALFERTLDLTRRGARRLERRLATRRLQPQLRWIVGVAIAAAALPIVQRGFGTGEAPAAAGGAVWLLALVWLIGGACAVAAAVQAKFHRLAAVILAGGAGLAVCVTFVWFSAPDLALTQLLVEIVTTVLLLIGLRWLPRRRPDLDAPVAPVARLRRALDFTLAAGAGSGLALLAYGAMTRPLPESVSRFFVERAYSEGGGTNVVNVILVDFRGFDTLGEITVLAVAGVAVYSLLRRFRPAPESALPPAQQHDHSDADAAQDLQVPGVIMRLMFPVALMLAAYLLLRGHNQPGGGFVAGLTMAVAFIIQYMAGGARWLESSLTVQPVRWMAIGLLLAVLTGAGAWAFAHPFLSSHVLHLQLPVLGAIHLPSAFVFDLGVFSLVLGATLLMLIALAHQSLRGDRRPRRL
ncbi:MAG TPA: monovalent cation/H+ antiporter subunit A [Rubrivivax sp.]|nr:monovalent cation/H+ antiporter subunit A [Rubrivivax sp.]HRZ60918.1 monovalent cation/H+ antiporter subunit A [Rubrivivax sp.]